MDPGITNEFALSIAERSSMGSSDGGDARLQAYLASLEEEKRKIEAFQRDLPLSVHLLNDVIQVLNRDLEQRRGSTSVRVFGHVITTGMKPQEQNELASNSEWRGAQFTRGGGGGDQFEPIEGYPTQMLSDATDNGTDFTIFATAHGNGVGGSCSKVSLGVLVGDQLNLLTAQPSAPMPPPRKARRCWSKELHGKFLSALEVLGGAQLATPKQIGEVMNVEGLTSDQVRSHLQKHRLNIQKLSISSNAVNGPQVQRNKVPLKESAVWQPGSDPQAVVHVASFNIGNSCEEEGDTSGI